MLQPQSGNMWGKMRLSEFQFKIVYFGWLKFIIWHQL